MLWWWAPGLPSAPTHCVTRGWPHTLSEPFQMGCALVPAAAGSPFGCSVAGAGPVGPAPPQSGASRPGLRRPFRSGDGWGTDGSVRAADTPPAQPGASPGGRGVGARSPAGAPGPLLSGSENRGLFRLQSEGPGPGSN